MNGRFSGPLAKDVCRRGVLRVAAATIAGWPIIARSTSEKVRTVGIIISLPSSDRQPRLTKFIDDMAALGWVEGRNVRYDIRSTFGGLAVQTKVVAEMVARKPDVIMVSSTYETAAVMKATRSIPIVFATAADPVGNGFVQSLARPGGNVTGFTNSDDAMGGKWLQFLTELDPRISRIGVLYNPQSVPLGGKYFLDPMRELAPAFNVSLSDLRVSDAAQLDDLIGPFAREGAGGLLLPPDSFTVAHRARIVATAARHAIPAIYPFRYFMDAGGLMSYGAELEVRGADYIDLILRGANPAELPVQSPRKYELLINRKVASTLGLTISDALMLRANQIFE